MTSIRWLFSILLMAMGITIVVSNWLLVVGYFLRKNRGSPIPFLGGIFLSVGLLLLPVRSPGFLLYLPLLVDYGSLPLVLLFLFRLTVGKK